ncbi:hypothetical protein PILCRDRAFT_81614, partial [Piloderma croceum F 1598]
RESPSEYIIRKLEPVSLVYSYMDYIETIQLLMEEVPDSWSSILNIQYYNTMVDFSTLA